MLKLIHVWWLQAASIRLPERTPRHSKTAPNCVPKPCSNLSRKLPNVPSEFLEKMSLFLPPAAVIRPPERTLRHSAGLNLPAKIPSRPFSIPRQVSLFYLLQLLFGGSKLQASGLQNGPFATAKQHLMACRNVMQTYPQKLPNVSSKFLRKCFFLPPAAVVW